MDHERKEQLLAENAYLWTSGEWTLRSIHYSRARVVLVFPEGRPTLRELIAVRALVPEFTKSPISLLKEKVGELAEFVAGEFGNLEARRLIASAHERGLQTRSEDTSYTGYLSVSKHGMALIIEDEEEAKLIEEEMLKRGVPIVSHTEVD
jgi:hypothetical protein